MIKLTDVCIGMYHDMPLFSVFKDEGNFNSITFDTNEYGLPIIDKTKLTDGLEYMIFGCGNRDMSYSSFLKFITSIKNHFISINKNLTPSQIFIISSYLYNHKSIEDFNFIVTQNRIIVDNENIHGTLKYMLDNTLSLSKDSELSDFFDLKG